MKVFEADFKTLPDWVLYCKKKFAIAQTLSIDDAYSNSSLQKAKQLELFEEKEGNQSLENPLFLEFW